MAKTDIFKPLTYQGTTYPSKEGYIADGNGVVQKRTYFRGSDGQYYAIDNNGNAVPMHLNNPNGGDAITLQYADSYQGDGPVVTPSEETWNYLRDRNQELQRDRDFSHFDIGENGKRMNLKSNVENHDLNARRQALMRVAGYDVPDNGLWDEKQQAIWDKLTIKDKDYDTTLTGFGKAMMDKLTGNTTYRDNPLIQDAVQAYNPDIIDKAKSSVNRALNTTAGKAITGTWGPTVAASALPGIPAAYIDAGLTSYFGAKGLTNLVNDNENWETALDIVPLGRVGKSVYDASTHLLQNTRDYYNLNNFINRYGYTEYKPKLGLIFDDAKLDKLTNQLVRQHNTFTRGISVDEARKYYGFGPEWTDEQIAEYTLTHPHVPTKFNSGGNPDQRAALYTSNSLDLSRQYTTGGGYVGIVQRPITYDSNRSKMLKINDFRFNKQPDNMYSATTDDPYVYSTVSNKPSKPRIDGGAAQRRRGKVNTKYTPVEPTFLDAQANAGASIIRTQRPDDLDFRHYIFYGDPDNSLLELKGLLRYNPSEGIVSTDYAPHSVGFTKKKAFGGKL